MTSIVTTNGNTARDQHVIYDAKNNYNKLILNTVIITITESVTGFLDTNKFLDGMNCIKEIFSDECSLHLTSIIRRPNESY